MKKKKYSIRIRIWIDEKMSPFLGIGRVMLLEKIQETGSITNAAKKMNMSYKKAWQLVEDMNKRSYEPLVEKVLGGKTEGWANLTKAGENAINQFYQPERKVQSFICSEMKNLNI